MVVSFNLSAEAWTVLSIKFFIRKRVIFDVKTPKNEFVSKLPNIEVASVLKTAPELLLNVGQYIPVWE